MTRKTQPRPVKTSGLVEFLQTAAAALHDPAYTPEMRRLLASAAIADYAASGPIPWPDKEGEGLINSYHAHNGLDPAAPAVKDPIAADLASKALLDGILRASHTVAAALLRSRGQR